MTEDESHADGSHCDDESTSGPALSLARIRELAAIDRPLSDVVSSPNAAFNLPLVQLSSRALRALEFARIEDWGAVLRLTTAQLAETKYLGPRQVDEVLSTLGEICGSALVEPESPTASNASEPDRSTTPDPNPRDTPTGGREGEPPPPPPVVELDIPVLVKAAIALTAITHDDGPAAVALRLGRWIPDVADGELFPAPALSAARPLTSPQVDEGLWRAATNLTTADRPRLNGPTWHLILHQRVLTEGSPMTLAALGEATDLTRERIRQIERLIRRELDDALRGQLLEPIRQLAADVSLALGPVTTHKRLASRISGAVLSTSAGADDAALAQRRALLRMLLGSFVRIGELAVRPHVDEHLATLARMVSAAEPGTLISPTAVDQALDRASFPPEFRGVLLEHFGLRTVEGWYVDWRFALQDKAVAVLAAVNEPLSMEELHDRVGVEANPRSLTNAVQSDPRVRRLGKESYGLAAWGGEEYSGILDELEQAIERGGGSVTLSNVVELFVELFGVSAQSVRSYANDRRFITEDGQLRFRSAEDPDVRYRRDPIELVPGTSLIEGVWHYRIDVTYDTLRGSGTGIRAAIAFEAGLDPDLTLGFDYGGAPITFYWNRTQPSLGSIRPVVEALGCVEGDLAFIPLTGPEPRSVRVIRGSDLAGRNGLERLQLELGLEPIAGETPEAAIVRALALPSGADLTSVADRLHDRGDKALVRLLPAEVQ